jgi:C1A family cysteine protease
MTAFEMRTNNRHYMYGSYYDLDQHAELDFYSANSLKQQSGVRYVALF